MIDSDSKLDTEFAYQFLQALIDEKFPVFDTSWSYEIRKRWIESASKIVNGLSTAENTPSRTIH
jgi:hypothetical protein